MCNSPCPADKISNCGGSNLNSVYKVSESLTFASRLSILDVPLRVVDKNKRPLLGLVMMVKDEAHTLSQNTLIQLKGYIDAYFILDTGSTDGTQELIRKTLEGVEGYILEEPFIDYGTSRNRALEFAQFHSRSPVFSLMLSADETVFNAYSLRKFAEEREHKNGHGEEAYPIPVDVGSRFDSYRLSRTDAGWRYVGRVHEYLAAPNGNTPSADRVPNTYIRYSF